MDSEVSAYSLYNSIGKISKKPKKPTAKQPKSNQKKDQQITKNSKNDGNEILTESKKKSPKKRKLNSGVDINSEIQMKKNKKTKVLEAVNGKFVDLQNGAENEDIQNNAKKKEKKSPRNNAITESANLSELKKFKKTNGKANNENSEKLIKEIDDKKVKKPTRKKINSEEIPHNPEVKKIKKTEKKKPSKQPKGNSSNEELLQSSDIYSNSVQEGANLLSWLLSPMSLDEFFQKYWEKDVLMVSGRNEKAFKSLLSFKMIDQMLLQNHVEFTKNIDITSYENDVRETHNPDGRALPPAVWEQYCLGRSIRLLNPQTFIPSIYSMCTTLQEYFHCMAGANVYLTPPKSQGFAPHYDDIEAFVLQIEGCKRWKIYKPRCDAEILPRTSSKNFSKNEIGEPIFDEILKPGDILYFPRGFIHQASTEPGHHSLHITLSLYQKQSYADLFELMMPIMLKRMITKCLDIRRGIPLYIWKNAGTVYSDVDSKNRNEFLLNCRNLMRKVIEDLPIDEAIDQMAKKYYHEALPPELNDDEIKCTIFGSKSILDENGECLADYEITLKSKIRLLRAHILRIVEEDDTIRLYYYSDNSFEYCEYKPNFIEITSEDATCVEFLIKSYPDYISVSELPANDDKNKISISLALWESGLIMLEKPISQE